MSLEELESYTAQPFNPISVSRDLIRDVNGTNPTELDIITPAKKVQFDMVEADKRLMATTGSNHEKLIANFTKLEHSKKVLTDTINPNVDRINSSFLRIHNNVTTPYNDAVKLNSALKRIHNTLDLLRRASHFIHLIQQIQSSEGVKLARLLSQLSALYRSLDSTLLTLRLIRDYQPILTNKCFELQQNDTNVIMGSRFEESSQELQVSLQLLFHLNETEFYAVVDKATISKQIQTTSAQLTRALQLPRNFTLVVSEIYENSKSYFPLVETVLQKAGLLEQFLQHEKCTLLFESYWERLGLRFRKSIAATMARGGPIAKNLRVYKNGILNLVTEIFPEGRIRDIVMEGVNLIT